MAKVIEFYIPRRFQKKGEVGSSLKRGKVIELCAPVKKSA